MFNKRKLTMKKTILRKLKYAKKYLLGNEFYSEHFDAALKVLDVMASDEPHTNHIILDALTQTGKTSVMEMIYRILNFESIAKHFGIKQVIYMTADNGSGDGSLKNQTIDRFKAHWEKYIHELPIDFLKRSDFDRFEHIMNDTLIMVDESQYGWREINSKGQKILQINGVNFCSIEELEKRNMYILSVSATTQNERYGDSQLKLKPVVRLKPGKGYVGIEDFIDNGILKPFKQDDFISSYEQLNDFLSKQNKKLKDIYKRTGIAKCVILRLLDNRRKGFLTDSEEFNDVANTNGFKCKLVVHKDSKIDYESLQSYIFYHCKNYGKEENKFLLVVIKYAFSYGITIKTPIKKLIATCYDVRKDTYSTEATTQGLPGRMTGYGCTIEDFKELEIYVNETHYAGIKANIDGINEYSTPLKTFEKTVQIKCEINKWDGDIYKIVIWNNDERTPLIFKGKIVDDFVKKHHKKEIDFSILWKEGRIDEKTGESFYRMIAKMFMEENGIFNKMGFGDTFFDFRRKTKEKDVYADRMCSNNPLLTNRARKGWRTEENAKNGEICWGAVIDITQANPKTLKGIVIKIPYGYIGFAKNSEIPTLKGKKIKKWSGYNTSLGSTIKTDVTIV